MDHTNPSGFLIKLRLQNVTKLSWVAAATVMVYDYGKVKIIATALETDIFFSTRPVVLTIKHEKSVWQRRWSLGKCLYFFTRYLGLFTAIFDISGDQLDSLVILATSTIFTVMFSANFTNKLVLAAVLSVEATIQKVYAVYERNNKLLMVLATSLVLGALASLLVMGLDIPAGEEWSQIAIGLPDYQSGVEITIASSPEVPPNKNSALTVYTQPNEDEFDTN
ncbi:hypothetical protein BU17DRAFT_60030 [Hysterangium stoloniferum]|nr:hypothetical protein BU17DRAFT_60030 [Hysterangium stoloniferum]